MGLRASHRRRRWSIPREREPEAEGHQAPSRDGHCDLNCCPKGREMSLQRETNRWRPCAGDVYSKENTQWGFTSPGKAPLNVSDDKLQPSWSASLHEGDSEPRRTVPLLLGDEGQVASALVGNPLARYNTRTDRGSGIVPSRASPPGVARRDAAPHRCGSVLFFTARAAIPGARNPSLPKSASFPWKRI